ncbi:FKBP-type peptidyl-prolyl cis-trans isomerase [Vulcaniibacterium gelatinicum]|uniref:FKBP-type peptidyl-prolyl cis-trans isomerase n=1 Tax=Vulcaniibacterium gelatinicum TaxID=2598725 RepID=UPI0011CAD95B|nr:FKBP-type peptidyl-prolyl cis-trans isomerase [Vulcaniibacterium gelatinicum]
MSKHVSRTFALTAAALAALATACQPPADKPAADKAAAEADGKTAAIAGLETEKEQTSYMIGMDIAKSLDPVKDEIDLDTLVKAMRTSLEGGKPLLDEQQAQKIRESFGQKLQAKQIAKMMAEAKKNLEDGQKFLADNAKKPGIVTTASGLQYQVITEGKGPKPKANDVVRVHYKGTLLDGKTFDSSYDRGEPVVFPLGQVVPGWQEGLQLMPVGSKYRLWIPAKLGYGERGTPGGPIGPNQTLVFEVELLEIVKQ